MSTVVQMPGVEARELDGDEADDVIRTSGWGYLDEIDYRVHTAEFADVEPDRAPAMLGGLITGLVALVALSSALLVVVSRFGG